MKLKLFFLILVAFTTFSMSCSKKSPVPNEDFVESETLVEGTVLYKKAWLCLFGRDGKMHSVVKIPAGEQIQIVQVNGKILTKNIPIKNEESTAPSEVNSLATENSNAIRNSSVKGEAESLEKENSELNSMEQIEYTRVVYENMDFWLKSSDFAVESQTAAMIEDSFVYADKNLTKRTQTPKKPLGFSTVVAKLNEDVDLQKYNSVKICYYDEDLHAVCSGFVLNNAISTRRDDIEVSRIAVELRRTTRAAPRNELFLEAAKYKPCAKVLAMLNAQKEEKISYNYNEVLKSMRKMSYGVNVDELLTVDQSKDPFK